MTNYKAILYVVIGAFSYGLLATIVKYANEQGIHSSTLTFLQFFIGFLALTLFKFIQSKRTIEKTVVTTKSKMKLIIWGTTLGLTTTLYYLSIQYIPVSVGIILLMQSIWISLLLEAIIKRRLPSWSKIVGVLIVLIGTVLATNLLHADLVLNPIGLLYGFGAGLTYAFSLLASSTVETHLSSITRSQYLVLGGLLLICIFWNVHIIETFELRAIPWGMLIALFGTVIAPIFFTMGIPKVGVSMGNIIASLEIPVSITSAVLILGESVDPIQWLGVMIILVAVIIINLKTK